MKKFFYYWLPPILWMSVIFYFSARPRIPVTEDYVASFVIFKTLHMIEYGFLYFLMFRALLYGNLKSQSRNKLYLIAFVIGVLYAASDETHQLFTPHREGTPRDVFIDSVGMGLMYAYIRYKFQFIKRFL